jgi:hypothetical protein
MGNTQCCSADGADHPEQTRWAAVLGPADSDATRPLAFRTAPGSPSGSAAPRVALFEGPDEQNRRLGYIEPGQSATALEESRDGRWVRVQVTPLEQASRHPDSTSASANGASSGLEGWVHARSVPQSVVVHVCERADLGYPSVAAVHAALSHACGDLTLAVKDLRQQHQSELSWTPGQRRQDRRSASPGQDNVARALDASRVVPRVDEDLAVSRPERLRRGGGGDEPDSFRKGDSLV